MFIRKASRIYKGKNYTHYMLVESYHTPKGPRQKTICSLGDLSPRPLKEWYALAKRLEAALSGQMLLEGYGQEVQEIVEKVKKKQAKKIKQIPIVENADEVVSIKTNEVEMENAREAGAVHVGHQIWQRLGMDTILAQGGLSEKARALTEAMTLNRLIFPASEHAMPEWIGKTALPDMLNESFDNLNEDALYRNMDKLHSLRKHIESELTKSEENLFNLDNAFYLYDLTSTYFEGELRNNPQAKYGYSRDKRSDCKQLIIGLVLDKDGFPKAHEIFDGNRTDTTTVSEMLDVLEWRVGRKQGSTVIVDRGMAFDANLNEIKARGYHYIVACRQSERNQWIDEFEDDSGWEEIMRNPSPRNPFQKKSKILVKRIEKDKEVYLLCLSEGRKQKDRAIRQRREKKLLNDLEKLQSQIQKGKRKNEAIIQQSIGRLKERYPRVARYYEINFDKEKQTLMYKELTDKKRVTEELDGGYIMKTDRSDMSSSEIWKMYVLLTRVENAFRNMKSPLGERPIFHQLEHRAQTHIFLCILAYHLLVCIEKMFLSKGIHTSWETIRKALSTHQVVTVVLPTTSGKILRIRKSTKPEEEHRQIYDIVGVPYQVIKPKKIWLSSD